MILFKEYGNFVPSSVIQKNSSVPFKMTEGLSDYHAPKEGTLMVEVEAIHAYPFHTRNFTRYMPEALRNSVPKWTTPYLKPLIKHHNDENGEIIGRIYAAEYATQTSVKNVEGLVFTLSVPDKKAAEEVENRILETVSIGVSANDVRCSICGERILNAEDGCPNGHARGHVYDGETCFWDLYDIDPKEVSYVIVPADMYAKNRKIYRADGKEQFQTMTLGFGEKVSGKGEVKIQESSTGEINPDMEELKKLLDEANAKIEALTAELDETKAKAEALVKAEAEKQEISNKLEEIKSILEDKEKEIASKDEELQKANSDLKVSSESVEALVHEKEAAEEAGMAAQESLRSFIEDTLNHYRKLFGRKEFEESELKKRSLDSLKDSINDFREEFDANAGIYGVIKMTESRINNPAAPKNETPPKSEKHKFNENQSLKNEFNQFFQEIF